MPQLSKIIKARDKWREKATRRAEELWENRKIVKYYKTTLLQLREDNTINSVMNNKKK